jgi:4-oxalmesaconate hydratase
VIIDIHAHYTSAPPQLDAFRGRQVSELNRPRPGNLKISDEEIERSLQGHFRQMRERGIDKLIFTPRASGMGHELGSELVSRYWSEVNNNLIDRVCKMFPDSLIPGCQLPQSPGVSPKNCIPELERCIKELGFVVCNINPDVSGGGQPFTPSLGSEWWYPLWEKMVELDVPGMIHASATQHPAQHLNGSHYTNQDNAAVVEVCNSRVFEDFPTLRLIIPHGGGAVPYQFNRHRALHVLEGRPPFEEVVKHLYFDTAVYDKDAMEMLIRKMGVDNVLFATEMFGTAKATDPKTGKGFDDTVELARSIEWLTDDDRHKLFEANARKVYSRAKWETAQAS